MGMRQWFAGHRNNGTGDSFFRVTDYHCEHQNLVNIGNVKEFDSEVRKKRNSYFFHKGGNGIRQVE